MAWYVVLLKDGFQKVSSLHRMSPQEWAPSLFEHRMTP